MKTIELEYEQIDAIVLSELKDCVGSLMDDGDEPRLVDSFLAVLEYLMPHSEYIEYVSNLRRDESTIEIVSVEANEDGSAEANEDGSADVTFEASPEQTKMLAAEGMKYLLMKAAFDVSEEDIVARLSND